MSGNLTWKKDVPNVIKYGPDAEAIVEYNEDSSKWTLTIMMLYRTEWQVILTGEFTDPSQLHSLVEQARVVFELED